MATEKFPGESLNLQGLYKIKEAQDIEITSLNETGINAANKSVKSHIERLSTLIQSATGGMLFQGNLNCSGNPNYPAGVQDQYWRVSVAGKIGGVSGVAVEVGDMIWCIATNSGGTEAAVGSSFQIQQANINRPYLILAEDAHTTGVDENVAGLSTALTLVNECKADINAHFADAGDSALSAAMFLANDLKAVYNLHTADAGGAGEEHTAVLSGDTISSADATDLASLITLITELLAKYDVHDNDAEQVAPVVHIATEAGDHSLASAAAPINLHECIVRVNDLKAKINAHVADSTCHTAGDSATTAVADAAYVEEHIAAQTAISADDATDLASLLALAGLCLTAYDTHDNDAEAASAWTYHVAQEAGNHSLTSAVTPTTLAEAITRLNDLKAKLNAHVADGTCHVDGDTSTVSAADAANGAAIDVSVSGALTGDQVTWAILNDGSSNVTGVSAVAGTDKVTFTFSTDPGTDAIISYSVFRPAV